ncbi:Smr/MutS family protein [Acetobacter senegalensis]|uniref:Smr/MutS family protein n=1 Tax=Acetobacter senegalensis TaxID=446692 RepID=UPI0038CF6D61
MLETGPPAGDRLAGGLFLWGCTRITGDKGVVKRRRLQEEEKTLWYHVMRDVVPLHGSGASAEAEGETPATAEAASEVPPLASVRPLPRKRRMRTVDVPLFVPPAQPPVRVQHAPHPTEEIGKRYPGVDNYSWRTFSQGDMRVERRLDLHGLVAQEAFRRLMEFMDVAQVRGLRCVEIITGLGSGQEGGILRRELPHWLARPEIRGRVLGLSYPHAGNKGSVRVLLRRRRG